MGIEIDNSETKSSLWRNDCSVLIKQQQNLREKDKPGAGVVLHFVPKIWLERLTIMGQAMQQKAEEMATRRRAEFQSIEGCCDWLTAVQDNC